MEPLEGPLALRAPVPPQVEGDMKLAGKNSATGEHVQTYRPYENALGVKTVSFY